jgi:uncharacterized protein (TIGR02452 family)
MAVAEGCDAVVWGAIGCGAFGNPATAVATAFRDLLHNPDSEFASAFDEVVYAVVKSPTNLKAFRAVLPEQ